MHPGSIPGEASNIPDRRGRRAFRTKGWRRQAPQAGLDDMDADFAERRIKMVDGQKLLLLFGLLMIVIAVMMLVRRKGDGTQFRPLERATAGTLLPRLLGMGGAVGGMSGFFGIGGGFLIVPGLMLATGMPMINAIGSSLLAVGSFGLATALNYAISGLVDWPIAFEFIVGGIIGGVIGMMLANRLASGKDTLNRLFAGLIFAVAAYVLYRSAGGLAA